MATDEDFRLWEDELSQVDELDVTELYDAARDMLGAIDPEEAVRTLESLGCPDAAARACDDLMRLTVGELFVVSLAQHKVLALFAVDDESGRQGGRPHREFRKARAQRKAQAELLAEDARKKLNAGTITHR